MIFDILCQLYCFSQVLYLCFEIILWLFRRSKIEILERLLLIRILLSVFLDLLQILTINIFNLRCLVLYFLIWILSFYPLIIEHIQVFIEIVIQWETWFISWAWSMCLGWMLVGHFIIIIIGMFKGCTQILGHIVCVKSRILKALCYWCIIE